MPSPSLKLASIDIGSNSLLLLIGEFKGGKWAELESVASVAGLGKDVDKTGLFAPEPMRIAFETLKQYKERIDFHGIPASHCVVTATEASRLAQNSPEFYKRVAQELGLKTSIITAEAEAYFTSSGVVRSTSPIPDELVIMDIGGASTELIRLKTHPFKMLQFDSFKVGSVLGTDWIQSGLFDEKMRAQLTSERLAPFKSDFLLCVAGSMTSVAAIILDLKLFDTEAINSAHVLRKDFSSFAAGLKPQLVDDYIRKHPFLGKRAKTFMAGAKIGEYFGNALGLSHYRFSTYGLRYGSLFHLHERLPAGLLEKYVIQSF